MGLFKNYVSQTRKPEGKLGKMMIKGMNSGHAKMAEWGLAVTETTSQVDVLSCPLHDMAKKKGIPEVCQTICAMDKVYMTGFRRIQYRRTKSVAEGDDCCDYRLWWDKEKK